jgi:hypothetical protein
VQRRLVAGVAAGAVVVLATGGYLVLRPSDEGTFGVASEPVVATEVPTVAPVPSLTPVATPSVSVPPEPWATPSSLPPRPTVVPSPSGPSGPRPLPTHCLSYGHTCAYPGKGALVMEPDWAGAERVGSDAVRVTWRPNFRHTMWPPVEDFVVQAYRYGPEDVKGDMARGMRDADHVTRARATLAQRAYTFRGLTAGARYTFCVFQVSVEGIAGICAEDITLTSPPERSPTPSPTPTPSATAEPTASATP